MRLTKAEIKYARSLSQKKVRDAEGKFILEGWKPLADALAAGAEIDYIATPEDPILEVAHQLVMDFAGQKQIALRESTALEMRQVTDTVQSQEVFAVVKQRRASMSSILKRKPRLIVACDEVNDPGNLGSIVRSCDWFGADALILSEGCVSLYNEKVVRATAGSIFHVDVVEHSDLQLDLKGLKTEGFTIAATAMDGSTNLSELHSIDRLVIVLGSEAHGIRTDIRSVADVVAAIPRFGKAESLNVGVACGIILAAIRTT
jgi:TrmH family RNA methyltransferase